MAGIYTRIQQSSYTQLGQMLTRGEVTIKVLQNYYRQELKKAKSRIRKLDTELVEKEYGKQDIPKFMSLKNLRTTSDLLHEIADISKFMRHRSSTIGGLKREKEARLQNLKKFGLNVTPENYGLWNEFVKWFNLSEYSKKFMYEAEEVKDVFTEALEDGKASPSDWEKLFKKYAEREDSASGVTQYR